MYCFLRVNLKLKKALNLIVLTYFNKVNNTKNLFSESQFVE